MRYIDPVSQSSHLKWSGMHVLPGSLATYIPNMFRENAPNMRRVSSHTSLMRLSVIKLRAARLPVVKVS